MILKKFQFLAAAGCACLLPGLLHADPKLAPLFRDGMVLQRDKPLAVWGKAKPGEHIKVAFHAQAREAVAGSDGVWRLALAAESASTTGSVLTVAGDATVTVSDVLVGDVWVCSGQSNMELAVARALDAEHEIQTANYPLIRQFKVPHIVVAQPADDCPGTWVPCSPASAAEFTAAGYFFARDLFRRNGVPIGLVNASWGGTQIEEWIGEPTLRANPAFGIAFERWQKVLDEYPAKVAAHAKAVAKWEADKAAAATAGTAFTRRKPFAPEGPGSRWEPAGMYNGMIHPLVPATIRGFLWYQGEENGARATEYAALFTTLIQEWRADFAQGDLPFLFVQLPGFVRKVDHTDSQWAFLREAQSAALKLPATGMAVTLDIGDPANIHPKNKQEVGRRLALAARAIVLGETVESKGPTFAAAAVEGTALRVRLTHADGLNAGGKPLDQFEVAGADLKFVPATATIDGQSLLVTAPAVTAPVAVRYAWKNCPVACLFNASNLPAAPFRSDEVPETPAR